MATELPYDLTPELAPLSWLIGSWEGQGRLGDGTEGTEIFYQRVDFTEHGLPFVEYRAESWLCEADGTLLRPLTVETGFWQVDRPRHDGDVGPGMVPADLVPAYRSAEDVESLRTEQDDFRITATIAHPGSMAELYYGRIKGPQLQLTMDSLLRGAAAGEYRRATRMAGLVNGQLFWRWDASAADEGQLDAHASAILDRMPDPTVGRLAPGAPRPRGGAAPERGSSA
ncbi:FABP family protein [Micrococcus sp.]|uniref:FABP family protein n=1 Tax=Micrococcus sp. TaxID=1271 RepID=UPI002A91F05C|nr:FABP family protein [Micrococcus sp.]MDY6055621.1 FABP family protein [Micrococcus sp.]